MSYWIIGTLVLSLLSPISYTRSMLAGKARPHRVTRLIVWLASVAGVLGVTGTSNVAGIIFAWIFLARATYLLVMAAIYGVGGWQKLDKYCLGLGVVALGLYVTTHNGFVTILFGILADLIGYIPTFVKTWRRPDSEDPVYFGIEALASLFAVFAVWSWVVGIMFPVYFTVCAGAVVVLIYRKRLAGWVRRTPLEQNPPV